MSAEKVRNMIETIVKTVVDKPENVYVNLVEGEKTAIVELKVSQDDIGKIIGREGRIVKAMRTLVAATSAKYNKRIILEIPET